MENVEFYTLEVSSVSHPEFTPCKTEGKIEEFESLSDAIARAPYYSCFMGDCVFRVVRHIHFSQVMCEVSKFNEPVKFELYERED